MFGFVVKFGKITNLMIWANWFVQSRVKEKSKKGCTEDFYTGSPQPWDMFSPHP